MWLFLTVPWVGLWSVIVVFPDHTHYFLVSCQSRKGDLDTLLRMKTQHDPPENDALIVDGAASSLYKILWYGNTYKCLLSDKNRIYDILSLLLYISLYFNKLYHDLFELNIDGYHQT